MSERRGGTGPSDIAELARLRRRIDALDRRIVTLLNERTELGRETGRLKASSGRGTIRDADREREVLLRVTIANAGPLPQADLLAIYRRIVGVARRVQAADRRAAARAGRSPAAGQEAEAGETGRPGDEGSDDRA